MRTTRVNRRKKYRKKKRYLWVLGIIVLVMFMGIGKGVGDKLGLNSVTAEEATIFNKNKKMIKNEDIDLMISEEKEEKNEVAKIAYLTFDDGPSTKVTPQVLDILDNYNIKATFFVIGSLAEKNPDLIKKEYESGHAIGNHTYSHDYKYIYGSVDNFLLDIDKAENVLKNILGEDFETKFVRFPGGSFGDKKQAAKKALKEKGVAYIDWNALNGDAEGHNIPKKRLVERVKETTKGKKKVVILMHDAQAKGTTVQALPEILDYLISQGYQFKPIHQEDLNGIQGK